jgi:hypothetical protein
VSLLAQQDVARIRGRTIEDAITGESAYLEQVAPTAAVKVVARHSDSPIMNTQHLRRRVAPYDYAWGDMVDKLDKVRLLIDPESTYARNAAMAMNRAWDDEIIAAFFGTAYTGHAGGTALTWPNGNSESSPTTPAGTQVTVSSWTYGNGSGNAGLTISKLIEAMVALDAAEGDENEPRYAVIQAKQKGNLLATTEATLQEYGVSKESVSALRDGQVTKIVGFELIHSERLLLDGSSNRRIPAWRRGAMGMGIAKDISGRIAERPDKRFSMYVYTDMSIGASRLEEAKLVEIACA